MTDFTILDATNEPLQTAEADATALHFFVDAELACVGGGGGLMDY